MIANYHTHTKRCHHAKGSDEQYVKAAIKSGLEVLGFSDHGPWPYENGYVSGIRMTLKEAQGYIDSIKKLKEKYSGQIEIKLGFEWEYFPRHFEWLNKFIKENGIDYAILGHHYVPYEIGGEYSGHIHTPESLHLYKENIIDAINSDVYAYVAHPDLFMLGYGEFDDTAEEVSRAICLAAKEKDIPLEYNVLGLRKSEDEGRELYPYSEFWRIAKQVGNKAVIGIDAHSPKQISDMSFTFKAESFLSRQGLEIVKKVL